MKHILKQKLPRINPTTLIKGLGRFTLIAAFSLGSWQLLVIRTNGVWRSHQTHLVPAEIVLLANEVHPCDFKSSDRNTPCLCALPP